MKHILFDNDGAYVTAYDRVVHSAIPIEAIEVHDTVWRDHINGVLVLSRDVDGTLVQTPPSGFTYEEQLQAWRNQIEVSAVELKLELAGRAALSELPNLAAYISPENGETAENLLDLIENFGATLKSSHPAKILFFGANRFCRADTSVVEMFKNIGGVDDAWIDDLFDAILGTKP